MKFFMFNQNDSGGSFELTSKVCHRVVIEAETYEDAEKKAFELGVYYGVDEGVDCYCCGDRWYAGDLVELNVNETIVSYCQRLANEYGRTVPDIRIFYADGAVKEIFVEKKE